MKMGESHMYTDIQKMTIDMNGYKILDLSGSQFQTLRSNIYVIYIQNYCKDILITQIHLHILKLRKQKNSSQSLSDILTIVASHF